MALLKFEPVQGADSKFPYGTRSAREGRRPGGTERQPQTLDLGSAADFGARISVPNVTLQVAESRAPYNDDPL